MFRKQKLPDNGALDVKLENISMQLKNFSDTVELKLQNTTENICNKMGCIEDKVEETRKSLDGHVSWHNNLYISVTKNTFKFIGVVFVLVCVVALVLGFKDGILIKVLDKVVG